MSGNANSTSIRNPILRYLHRDMNQLIFARIDGGGVSHTEIHVMWFLPPKGGVTLAPTSPLTSTASPRRTEALYVWGIDHVVEQVGLPTINFTVNIGEMFITYEVLLTMGLMKTDSRAKHFSWKESWIIFSFQSHTWPKWYMGQSRHVEAQLSSP